MADCLISSAKLAGELNDVVVLDCRFSLAVSSAGRDQFEPAHIPGAFHLDMEADMAGEKTGCNGRHPLPRRADFEARLRSYGVNASSRIVVYDDNRFAGAARAWWLLRYWGHDAVRILDGGFKGWLASGGASEAGAPATPPPGDVTLSVVSPDALIDLAAMKDAVAQRSAVIIDSREPARFDGKEEPIDPIAGRIPGAQNAPWQDVTDAHGVALDKDAQRARWAAITPDERPIVYCGSGVTACVNLFSRALAGLPPGRLYNGSWSEWCAQDDVEFARG